jgi:hypothetical protein
MSRYPARPKTTKPILSAQEESNRSSDKPLQDTKSTKVAKQRVYVLPDFAAATITTTVTVTVLYITTTICAVVDLGMHFLDERLWHDLAFHQMLVPEQVVQKCR